MKTQPTLGNFLAQGFAGGALGGFIFVLLSTLQEGNSDFGTLLSSTLFCMVVGSIIGVIEAACIRALDSAGIQMRAATRVSVVSVVATLIVVLAGLQFTAVENALSYLLMMTLSFAVPPALLAGSNFRPSELFTFGTIAVRGVGFDELFESKSVWAIAGTLPLRFLSLGIAGLWLMYLANRANFDVPLNVGAIIVGALPLLYTGISAFLTFRSPGKLLLVLLGIGGNIPVVFGGLICLSFYSSFPSMNDLLVLSEICLAFLFSWTIFLMARMSVDTSKLMPLSILPDKILPTGNEEVW